MYTKHATPSTKATSVYNGAKHCSPEVHACPLYREGFHCIIKYIILQYLYNYVCFIHSSPTGDQTVFEINTKSYSSNDNQLKVEQSLGDPIGQTDLSGSKTQLLK